MKYNELMIIHSYWTDCLDKDHPLAYEYVSCSKCKAHLHAFNNETMQEWVEFQNIGALCINCFGKYIVEVWKGETMDHDEELKEWCIKKLNASNITHGTITKYTGKQPISQIFKEIAVKRGYDYE